MARTNIKIGILIVLNVLVLFLWQCRSESKIKKTNEISIELYPDSLFLEQRQIKKKDFEKELRIAINIKLEAGFKRDELTIVLKVDENTRRGDVADIQTSMRRLNVRKVIYSTFGKKQASAKGFSK
jgi:biopolymer transport protein ExbD